MIPQRFPRTSEPPRRQRLHPDRRAVSEVLGVLLAFSLVVSVAAVVQVNAVPVWNGDLEHAHSRTSHDSLVELDEAVARVSASGVPERATVDPGVEYPTRLVFRNPPPATGALETTDPATVTLSNVEAVGGASTYWDGTDRTFQTRAVTLRTDYRELDTDPVFHYEGTVLFTDHDDTVVVTQQTLLNGNHVSLVALDGDLSTAGTAPVTVDVTPVSVGGDPLVVRNDGSDAVTLTLPTRLSEAAWEAQLDGTYGSVSGYTAPAGVTPGFVTVTLARGVHGGPDVYKLHLSQVRLGPATPTSTSPPAAYLVAVDGDGEHVPEGGSQLAVVEVRDGFDNPVAGATIRARMTDGTGTVTANGVEASQTVTGVDGRGSFVYVAPDSVSGPTPETVTVEVLDEYGAVVDAVQFTVEVRER